jgi:hypothetical protein
MNAQSNQSYSLGICLLVIHVILVALTILEIVPRFFLLLLTAYAGLIAISIIDYWRHPDDFLSRGPDVIQTSIFVAYRRILPVALLSIFWKGAFLVSDLPVLGLLGDLGLVFSIMGLIYCCGFGVSYWGILLRHKEP